MLCTQNQSSFILGIRNLSPRPDETYLQSAKDINNFMVSTGGSLIRRRGSEVEIEIQEPERIIKIKPLFSEDRNAFGYVYLTHSKKIKFISTPDLQTTEGVAPEVPLSDFQNRTFDFQMNTLSEETLKINEFISPSSYHPHRTEFPLTFQKVREGFSSRQKNNQDF